MRNVRLLALLASVSCLALPPTPLRAQTAFGITPQFAKTIAVTNSSGRVQLGGNGQAVLITNTGTVNVFLGFGDVTVVATTSGHSLAAGQCIVFNAPPSSYVAAITASSTSTIQITQGNGSTTCSGVTGSAAASTAVTIADGADVAQGSTTDAACAGDNTSGCTIEARLQRIAQRITTLIGTVLAVTPNPSSAAAAATTSASSTAAASNLVLKGSAGNLYNLTVTIGATSGYLLLFDATALPSNGAVTPVYCLPVTSNGTNGGAALDFSTPKRFGTGITAGFSTTGCFTLTASTTANFFGGYQ